MTLAIAGLAIALAACAGTGDAEQQEQVAQNPAAMLRIAGAAETSGDLASAEAFYLRAAALQPDLIAAQIGAARTLAQQGKVDRAIDVLRSAHARTPRDSDLTKTLGRLLVVAKRPTEAVTVFTEGLAVDPQSTSFLVGKGVALDKLARHNEAQQSYEAALSINPDDATARNNLVFSKTLTSVRE